MSMPSGGHDAQPPANVDGVSSVRCNRGMHAGGPPTTKRGLVAPESGTHWSSMMSSQLVPSRALPMPGLRVHERRTLGDGACGDVYVAELDGAPVAVKRLATPRPTSACLGGGGGGGGGGPSGPVRQFTTEIRRLADLRSSPYVVQFFDTAQDPANPDGPPLIVMELAEGGSVHAALRSVVNAWNDDRSSEDESSTLKRPSGSSHASCEYPTPSDRRSSSSSSSPYSSSSSPTSAHRRPTSSTPNRPRMPLETVERIARSLANGLAYLHSRGYSHGDIKPLNLLLTHKLNPQTGLLPRTAWVKLCDFGLSRRLTQSPATPMTPQSPDVDSTRSGIPHVKTALGTFPYCSPEAFNRKSLLRPELARAADVYACGIVLYELLTLQAPWKGLSPTAIYNRVVNQKDRPPWPDSMNVHPGWVNLVHRCWSHHPFDRLEAEELSMEIENLSRARTACASPNSLVRFKSESECAEEITSWNSVLSEIRNDEINKNQLPDTVPFSPLSCPSDVDSDRSQSMYMLPDSYGESAAFLGEPKCRPSDSRCGRTKDSKVPRQPADISAVSSNCIENKLEVENAIDESVPQEGADLTCSDKAIASPTSRSLKLSPVSSSDESLFPLDKGWKGLSIESIEAELADLEFGDGPELLELPASNSPRTDAARNVVTGIGVGIAEDLDVYPPHRPGSASKHSQESATAESNATTGTMDLDCPHILSNVTPGSTHRKTLSQSSSTAPPYTWHAMSDASVEQELAELENTSTLDLIDDDRDYSPDRHTQQAHPVSLATEGHMVSRHADLTAANRSRPLACSWIGYPRLSDQALSADIPTGRPQDYGFSRPPVTELVKVHTTGMTDEEIDAELAELDA